MMIDIHSHIIPSVDDGAEDMDISLKMLRIAENDGITHMIATPHFIHGALNNNEVFIRERLSILRERAESEGIRVSINPGSEVFMSPEIPMLAEEGIIGTLNGSRYVLVELPMGGFPQYVKDVFYQLRLKGYIPILAHPERNNVIAEEPNLLYDLLERGVLSQINATSITGLYGTRIMETAMLLLNHGMVHFVSSDAHSCKGRAPRLNRSRDIVETQIGRDVAQRLFEVNGNVVLEDRDIEAAEFQPVKKKKSFMMSLFNFKRGWASS